MEYATILLSTVFIPVFGAFFLPLIGRFSKSSRNILALCLIAASFILSMIMVRPVLSGHTIHINIPFLLGLNFVMVADQLAVFMAGISSFISTIIVFYSFGYIDHYENQSEYYLMVVLFLGAMMGLVFSGNLILLYLFWEITAITSWRLIGFYREKDYVRKADKAFLVTVFGAVAMLLGFIILYEQAGTFDLDVIAKTFAVNPLSGLAVGLILAGILSKSATLPFHTWLPDAGVAPSPVTALLHAAILVKIGVYVYARLFLATFSLDVFWHTAVPVIAVISALVAAGAALVETDLKRLIAFSTVSQIGFIFFGLSVGGPMAAAGGLLYILMHGLAKAGLFLCAGIVEQNMGEKNITKLGGLITTMPVTAVSFLLCSFAVMGIPPFGGFFSKYMVIAGGVYSGQWKISMFLLAAAFMTIIYLFRVFNMVFLGEAKTAPVAEKSRGMVVSVAVLAVLSLLAGIFINYPASFAESIIAHLPGIIR